MDFNLRVLGAETVMVDSRLAVKLAEGELLQRNGEELPFEKELNSFTAVQNNLLFDFGLNIYS